jgi:hypothetical protein
MQVIRDSSPDLPTLLDDYKEYGGVCVFETIFGCVSHADTRRQPPHSLLKLPLPLPANARAVVQQSPYYAT